MTTLSRYILVAIAPALMAGLFTCTQVNVTTPEPVAEKSAAPTPAAAAAKITAAPQAAASSSPAPVTAQTAAPLPSSEAQSVDPQSLKQSDPLFDACFGMFAYDPNDSSVNLRDRPDGRVIAALPNLTRLNSEGPAGADPGWNRVYAIDTQTWGYVWGDLIYLAYYQVQDPQDTFANLRQSPNGKIIAALDNGTEVRFLGTEGDWTKVALEDGQTGYIKTSLLTQPNCF